MSGELAPLATLVSLAQRYNALLYVDEVHGVGLYGTDGAGLAQGLGLAEHVDILVGNFGKAIGGFGGYIAADANIIDTIRGYATPFIFTTALPPATVAAAHASVRSIQKARAKRQHVHNVANYLRTKLQETGLPVPAGNSHIVPLPIPGALRCRQIADWLLENWGLYAQPINYPTVARGDERLRLTATACHTIAMADQLIAALQEAWRIFAPAPEALEAQACTP